MIKEISRRKHLTERACFHLQKVSQLSSGGKYGSRQAGEVSDSYILLQAASRERNTETGVGH